jgi:hypothetical protein
MSGIASYCACIHPVYSFTVSMSLRGAAWAEKEASG